ncbi:uncharacterized protein A1O5_12430 [Cladophialophora psammophila CBS 110553]|uniref:Uncharacterized protein n=1 Tax=Cladophialophora psammophila CBS 110553 TaxID=1182543 RepID=W9VQA6_9EURO|nr:uncharacterized protein A1O5_12430 [Cladophialophora psammophila CBS 110553]EXJ57872.1 hypothetical protein A1O5_12430 [Cladophialophora psammophila CBS 110553]
MNRVKGNQVRQRFLADAPLRLTPINRPSHGLARGVSHKTTNLETGNEADIPYSALNGADRGFTSPNIEQYAPPWSGGTYGEQLQVETSFAIPYAPAHVYGQYPNMHRYTAGFEQNMYAGHTNLHLGYGEPEHYPVDQGVVAVNRQNEPGQDEGADKGEADEDAEAEEEDEEEEEDDDDDDEGSPEMVSGKTVANPNQYE